MNGRLLYHKTKGDKDSHGLVQTEVERDGVRIVAYSDDFSGNQDPYIWQEVFLHTYCHMGQMREGFSKPRHEPEVKKGDIHFWITSPKGDYSKLYCDLVFVIADQVDWPAPNDIRRCDSPAKSDSDAAFEEHYAWVKQHCLSDQKKKYGRFTLKADPLKSFQPQDEHGCLLDIRLWLKKLGVDLTTLEEALGPKKRGRPSRPFLLSEQQARDLYAKVLAEAHFRRTGMDFAHPDFEQQRKLQKRLQTPPDECPQRVVLQKIGREY